MAPVGTQPRTCASDESLHWLSRTFSTTMASIQAPRHGRLFGRKLAGHITLAAGKAMEMERFALGAGIRKFMRYS
jgi:hypothetical protein